MKMHRLNKTELIGSNGIKALSEAMEKLTNIEVLRYTVCSIAYSVFHNPFLTTSALIRIQLMMMVPRSLHKH